ncbi:MAG: hypothetical protein IAA89_00445 [Firmicutes bacterium]|uniref:Uncharacterized protein n=1 Tax=Candidatus Gallilactobacillus intestinavium TaxID=2840838 RepID=A0A9D9H4M1_9LACO|nr:hypothetical protein [Candidatus Gallilactobacillus intestinavium]
MIIKFNLKVSARKRNY